MATPKKTNAPKRTSSPARPASTPAKASSPKASATKGMTAKNLATNIRPVRAVPTSPIVHSKTLANGQPRPKSRRSK